MVPSCSNGASTGRCVRREQDVVLRVRFIRPGAQAAPGAVFGRDAGWRQSCPLTGAYVSRLRTRQQGPASMAGTPQWSAERRAGPVSARPAASRTRCHRWASQARHWPVIANGQRRLGAPLPSGRTQVWNATRVADCREEQDRKPRAKNTMRRIARMFRAIAPARTVAFCCTAVRAVLATPRFSRGTGSRGPADVKSRL
jgi:hypothetical protein